MKKNVVVNALELLILNDLLSTSIIDDELYQAAIVKIKALTEDTTFDSTHNTVVPA